MSENGAKHPKIIQAEEAFKIRDFDSVIVNCQAVLKEDPSNEEAQKMLQKAIELQEAEPFLQSFISTGQTLMESGLYADAIKQFEKVKVIDPNYPGIDDLITEAKAALHGDVYAATAAEAAPTAPPAPPSLSPTEEKVQSIIRDGQRLFEMGEYQQAIDTWSEVFMYDITNQTAHELIEKARSELLLLKGKVQKLLEEGKRLFENKDYQAAEKVLREVLQIEPANPEAHQYLSMLASTAEAEIPLEQKAEQAYLSKNWSEAISLYQKILQAQPDNALASKRLAECKTIAIKQEQVNKLISDAQLFHTQGKKDSAIFALQKALEIDPGNKEAEMFLATLQVPTKAPTAAVLPKAKEIPVKLIAIPVIIIALALGAYFLLHKKTEPKPTTIVRTFPIRKAPVKKINKPKEIKSSPQPNQNTPSQPEKTLSDKELLALLDEAHNLYTTGNLPAALLKYKEILSYQPDNKDALERSKEIESTLSAIQEERKRLLNEAERYYKLQDYEGVVKVLKAANQRFPDDKAIFALLKDGYYNLGIDELKKKRCQAAVDFFKQIEFLDAADHTASAEIELANSCSGKSDIEPSTLFKIDALQYRAFNMPPDLIPNAGDGK